MASNDSPSPKPKDFWNYLKDNYKEVSSWPRWMRGETTSCDSDEQAVSPPEGSEQESAA